MASIDISTAFLRSDKINGDVYSDVPPGLENLLPIQDDEILRLRKGVYGL